MKSVKTVKKTGNSKKPLKSKKTGEATMKKQMPGEEEIREKAEEIYHQRIARGEDGTAEGDWLKAEAYLKKLR
jgi:hypothetical protein